MQHFSDFTRDSGKAYALVAYDISARGVPRKSGKKKYARLNDVWAFSAQTRNWTNLIADADEPQIQAAAGLPACLANDSVQLAIALVVAFLVTGAALRARFRHDDAYDGPPGVQASPYVGVA